MISNIGGPAILIFIGALISATGAIWASIQHSENEKQLRLKTEKIAEKSDEIANLNTRISKSITGGDSFAYITPSFLSKGKFPESLMVVHQGEFPLYDIGIRIVDLDEFKMELAKNDGSTDLNKVGTNLNLGNLSPNTATFSGVTLRKQDNISINIFFTARNGSFSEQLRVAKVGDEYKTAIQVSGLSSTGLLFEKIDPGFPRNDKGEVEW